MKTLVVLMIAVVIWLAGINGNFGSILAAIIDPGSLVDGSNPDGISASSDPGTSSPFNSATKQGTLPPPPPTKPVRVNKAAFQRDSAQLQLDLTIGNFNPNIGDQWAALNANFALQNDVNRNASRAQLQKDLLSLQQSLNKLNDPMYNADYKKIYADLGF